MKISNYTLKYLFNMQPNTSFTITHHRTSVRRSFWKISDFYLFELEKWLTEHGDSDPDILVEENKGEIIIKYNNENIPDTNIRITIFCDTICETTCFSENSVIVDELKREVFQKFLKNAMEKIIAEFQSEEDELEEDFQEECMIEYARDRI
jgi:hypothetical protein